MLKIPSQALNGLQNGDLIASLDLGSNSFHFLLVRLVKTQAKQGFELEIVQRIAEKVQLAAGLNSENFLDAAAQARGLACLEQIAPYLQGVDKSKLSVVATNTLRVATNAQEFLNAAQQVLGVPVQVISGLEEARLVYAGVVESNPAFNTNCLVIDIGGGSTEFILGKGSKPLELASLKMGCVSFSQVFFKNEAFFKKSRAEKAAILQQAVAAAKQEINSLAEKYKSLGWQLAYGSSGSMKVLALIANQGRLGSLTLAKLEAIQEQILAHENLEFWLEYGVRPNRLELLPAGLAIAMAAFQELEISSMEYSDGALREGLLHQLLLRAR